VGDRGSGISNSSLLPVSRRSGLSFSSACANRSALAHSHPTGVSASAERGVVTVKIQALACARPVRVPCREGKHFFFFSADNFSVEMF